MAFPTLARKYASMQLSLEDNSIGSPLNAGYEYRRPRFTRNRKSLALSFNIMTTADKDLLLAHFASVGLSETFVFTDKNSNNYTVYYTSPFSYRETLPGWWQFETITMKER